MKSNYKIFTAVFLSAIMTAAAPLTVCGAEVSSGGVISGTPQKEGSFSFTVQADNGIGVSSQELSLYVAQREQEPVIKQYELTSGTALINLGIHAEGEQSRKRLFLYNAGTEQIRRPRCKRTLRRSEASVRTYFSRTLKERRRILRRNVRQCN